LTIRKENRYMTRKGVNEKHEKSNTNRWAGQKRLHGATNDLFQHKKDIFHHLGSFVDDNEVK
jgi:hypothetical protein